jgi:hypothetical protein
MDDDFYNYVDVTELNTFKKNESELDALKANLMDDYNEPISTCTDAYLDIKGIDYDKYDESYITKDIVNKMLQKDFVNADYLFKDEGTNSKRKNVVDFQTKIEMRHQAVKENREKRQREAERIKREKMAKKEAEMQAKLIVQREENEKKARKLIEQQLIEQEAERIRTQMTKQRKADEELKKKYFNFKFK